MNHYAPAASFIFMLYFGNFKEEAKQWNKCLLTDKNIFKIESYNFLTIDSSNYLGTLLNWAVISDYIPEFIP